MAIENPPFIRQKLDGEERPDTITVRFNKEERLILEDMKKTLNTPFDSKALKFCARVGFNVLLTIFGREGLAYLLSQERRKLEEL